jgi:hypothetical protein
MNIRLFIRKVLSTLLTESQNISPRCNKEATEVHHIRRTGMSKELLNDKKNGEALCHECHVKTSTHHQPLPNGEESPPRFSERDIKDIMEEAGYRCQCTRKECHQPS